MAAALLATVAATQMITGGKHHQPVLQVIVLAFNQGANSPVLPSLIGTLASGVHHGVEIEARRRRAYRLKIQTLHQRDR